VPMENTMRQAVRGASALNAHFIETLGAAKSKVGVLCDKDREMMLEFSRLCVGRLNNHLPLRLFLSLFQHFLNDNVQKEIEKDRLIMEHAAASFEWGKVRADMDVTEVFEMTKKVDHEFIKKMSNPLFSIEVRYDDFAETRKKRIVALVSMVFDLLCNWQDALPFADNVKSTFGEKVYREALGEILHLYNIETRLLSNSITFHGPAGKVKDLFAEKLFAIMEKTAGEIAVIYTRKIYVEKDSSFGKTISRPAVKLR